MGIDRIITVKALVITGLLAASAAVFYTKAHAVAVVVGGLVAVANFRLGAQVLKRIVVPGMKPAAGQGAGIVSFLVRYAILAAELYVIINLGIEPVAFLVGLSVVVAAVFASVPTLKRGEV